MKAKSKNILLIIFAYIIGIVSLYMGFQEWTKARQLAADGITTKGQVLEVSDSRGRKGRHTYRLTVEFTPTNSSTSVTQKVEVSESVFTAAADTKTTTVHYLPSNPTICSAGEAIEPRYSRLLWGAIFLGVGILLTVFFRKIPDGDTSKEEPKETSA